MFLSTTTILIRRLHSLYFVDVVPLTRKQSKSAKNASLSYKDEGEDHDGGNREPTGIGSDGEIRNGPISAQQSAVPPMSTTTTSTYPNASGAFTTIVIPELMIAVSIRVCVSSFECSWFTYVLGEIESTY